MFATKMEIFVIALIGACVQLSNSFMTLQDLSVRHDLQDCYNARYGILRNMRSREDYQPLSNSMETFISIVEKLEASNSMRKAADIIQKLLMSYRIDDIPDDFKTWKPKAISINEFEKYFFNIPDKISTIDFKDELTDNEKCTLHFMLSHTVNYTAISGSNEDLTTRGKAKHPRESGVVNLNGKEKHAFALDRVLLGILAALSGNQEIIPTKLCTDKCDPINKLYAMTLGNLISIHVSESRGTDNSFKYAILPNGVWNDLSCPTEYILEEVKSGWYITNSLIRGAVDGLIIGKKLLTDPGTYNKLPLSQILRMYYGPTGLLDSNDVKSGARSATQWCSRDRLLNDISDLQEKIFNFHKLYTTYSLKSTVSNEASNEINEALTLIKTTPEMFVEMSSEGSCGSTMDSAVDRCTTPFDIFAIMDWQPAENIRSFQAEVIGNLSASFDVRPNGNSVGVYRNARLPFGLEILANNSGLSGCSACFIKNNPRTPSRISEIEVFEKLNQTLTSFEEARDIELSKSNEPKFGSPSKVILYFNYGSAVDDYKLGEAIWEVKKSFPETTILAIGSRRDSLKIFTTNDDTDIFTESSNALMFLPKLRTRICKVPAEFQYKDCYRKSTFSGEGTQVGVIGLNKKQYWAMYPKYFLKSFYITLKFKAQDGAKIRVCFDRHYYRIIEENNLWCFESGDEIVFTTSNPCHRRSEYSCDAFYFLVEGKQVGSTGCDGPRCSTPRDIQFEFSHEGISCNGANFLSISSLALLLVGLIFIFQRH